MLEGGEKNGMDGGMKKWNGMNERRICSDEHPILTQGVQKPRRTVTRLKKKLLLKHNTTSLKASNVCVCGVGEEGGRKCAYVYVCVSLETLRIWTLRLSE